MNRRLLRCAAACSAIIAGLVLMGADMTDEPAEPPQLKHGKILVIPIEGEINRVQGAFFHRVLADANEEYDALVIEMNTPGGRSDIMAKIARDILALKIPTITYVSPWAISAGSYIAMSTDHIYMAPGAVIGGARGWVPGPDGLPVELPKSVEEKMGSIGRAQFRAIAERKGYPAAIAEGMTDETLEITKIVYDGQTRYVTAEELQRLRTDPVEADKVRVVEIVSPAGKLITFTANEAAKYDIARKVVDTLGDVLKEEGLDQAKIVRKNQTPSDKLIAVLTSAQIAALLVLVGFGGIWLEFKMPGFGVAGTIAVIAFLLVFSSQFLVGNANALEILLFVVGLALLAIEIFVTPGFGLLGAAGMLCVFVSLLLAMQPFTVPEAPWEVHTLQVNLLATAGGILGSFIVLLAAAWLLPGTPLFARLTLHRELKAADGFTSGVQHGDLLVGKIGEVVTALRPAGKLKLDDQTYSVVSDSEFVEIGRQARVIRVDGPRIVVEPLAEEKPRVPDFQA